MPADGSETTVVEALDVPPPSAVVVLSPGAASNVYWQAAPVLPPGVPHLQAMAAVGIDGELPLPPPSAAVKYSAV